MTWLDVNVNFPCPTVAFLLLIPPHYSTLFYYSYFSFPYLSVLWQKSPKESSEQKAISLLLRMPQHLHLTHPPQLEHHQGEMLPHQAITLKLIHFNRADLKVTSESTDDIFKQVWRLHHGYPPHHRGCWGNQGQPRITSSSPGLPASISLPQTKAGGAHNECHWRDKHAPLHCLLSSGISSTRNVPHNKVFIPACNTSSFFSRACCAYHTEVLGGLITQCLQRALKIKCAK